MTFDQNGPNYYTYITYLAPPKDGDGPDTEKVDFILLPMYVVNAKIPHDQVNAFVGPRFPYPFDITDPFNMVTKDEQLDTECGVWRYNTNIDFYIYEDHVSHFVRTFNIDD